ncbi:hypothetical protein E2I00_004710, partial [Balaenoptera physalus]
HKLLPYSLLAFAAIMYVPALGWEFLASTRLTSELNFLLQEIDNCYHRAAEGRAPKIEKQIQSKGPGITERERREIIENAEKEKSPEQNLFEKYLERRGRSNFLAKLYLARHLLILLLSVAPISYLCTYYATQKQNEFTCALGAAPGGGPAVRTRRQWRRSQFCDINILAMFCNENRDHIKSLNRLDFITNESDLMYDNVEGGFLSQAEECGLGLTAATTTDAPLPEKEVLFPAEPARATLPSGGPFHILIATFEEPRTVAPLHDRSVPLPPAPCGRGLCFARHCPHPGLLSACHGAQRLAYPAPQMASSGRWLGQGLAVTPVGPVARKAQSCHPPPLHQALG